MAKAGRKRKVGVAREANGKPSRAGKRLTNEQDAMSVAVAYRQSVFGVSAKDVMDQKASTALGRLCLQGAISEHQWRAGEEWGQLVNSMHASVSAPRGFKTAGPGASPVSDEEHARRVKAIKTRFDEANNAVAGYSPPIEQKERFEVLRSLVLEDSDIPHMHGVLRVALNGLVKHFGYEGRKAA